MHGRPPEQAAAGIDTPKPEMPFEQHFVTARADKELANQARENKQPAEASSYFELACVQLTALAALLYRHIYTFHPTTGETIFVEMNDENRAYIYRYIEIITTLGELLLNFDHLFKAEVYLLEYIKLSNHHSHHQQEDDSDSFANDYFNLGVINQARFDHTKNQSDLFVAISYFIKALAEYRRLDIPGECEETAKYIINTACSIARINKSTSNFQSPAVKTLITTVIANVLSISYLQELFSTHLNMREFFSHQRWRKLYTPVEVVNPNHDEENEIISVRALQEKLTPGVMGKYKLAAKTIYTKRAPVDLGLEVAADDATSTKLQKISEQNDSYPYKFSLWALTDDKRPEPQVEEGVWHMGVPSGGVPIVFEENIPSFEFC